MEAAELYKMLEAQYFGSEMHERKEMELLPGLLEGVKSFVDVGASLGPYSYYSSKVIQNGQFTCIEADPVRVRRLKELTQEWEKTTGNKFTVVHAAAADKAGKMDFFLTDACISGALFKHEVPDQKLKDSLTWTKVEVDVITLDGLFKDADPDLIKIDVEGAEYRVLLGAREILKRGKSRFLVEVHPWGDEPINKKPADVFNLFTEHGYDMKRVHRHWLFQKSGNGFTRYVKNRAVVFIYNNEWLKTTLKQIVLVLSGSTKR